MQDNIQTTLPYDPTQFSIILYPVTVEGMYTCAAKCDLLAGINTLIQAKRTHEFDCGFDPNECDNYDQALYAHELNCDCNEEWVPDIEGDGNFF